jgi:hypothetical protein
MRINELVLEFAPPQSQEDPFVRLADIAKETAPGDPYHEQAVKLMDLILNKIQADQPPANAQPQVRQPANPQQPPPQQPAPVQQQPQLQQPVSEDREYDDSVWEEYVNSIQDPKERNKVAKDPKMKEMVFRFVNLYDQKRTSAKQEINDMAKALLTKIAKTEPSESEIESLIAIFRQTGVPDEQMKFFLKGANSGKIINMARLVSHTGPGKIDNFVNSTYRSTFTKVIGSFFNLADGMRTAGNIGPGEVAFVLLGNPAKKMNKGDLEVGNESFEVKASSDSPGKMTKKGVPGASKPNGAVFGAKVNQKPASAWPNVQEILHKYGIKETTRLVSDKDGNTKELERFKINASGMTDFNNQLDLLKMSRAKRAKLMFEILKQLFPKIINQDKAGFEKKILAVMDPKTAHFPTSDQGSLMKLIANIALEGYKLEKHKENFIFFNKSSRNFYVFRGDGMEEAINDGTIKLFKGIDWSDGQYPAAPKMYIA